MKLLVNRVAVEGLESNRSDDIEVLEEPTVALDGGPLPGTGDTETMILVKNGVALTV